ncbi:hypothetical protein ACQY0O_003880 [Thecaphora frezii]
MLALRAQRPKSKGELHRSLATPCSLPYHHHHLHPAQLAPAALPPLPTAHLASQRSSRRHRLSHPSSSTTPTLPVHIPPPCATAIHAAPTPATSAAGARMAVALRPTLPPLPPGCHAESGKTSANAASHDRTMPVTIACTTASGGKKRRADGSASTPSADSTRTLENTRGSMTGRRRGRGRGRGNGKASKRWTSTGSLRGRTDTMAIVTWTEGTQGTERNVGPISDTERRSKRGPRCRSSTIVAAASGSRYSLAPGLEAADTKGSSFPLAPSTEQKRSQSPDPLIPASVFFLSRPPSLVCETTLQLRQRTSAAKRAYRCVCRRHRPSGWNRRRAQRDQPASRDAEQRTQPLPAAADGVDGELDPTRLHLSQCARHDKHHCHPHPPDNARPCLYHCQGRTRSSSSS